MELLKGILHNFGVEWPQFFAQLIVFGIVYVILKKYAFGPIVAVLEQRRLKIVEAMANADKVKKELADAEATKKKVLDAAAQQANKMVADAKESAEAVRVRLEQEATAEAERIIARAREGGQIEVDRLKADFQREAGRLVVMAAQKVTGKILTPEDQHRLSEEAAQQAVR
jgi:F-type H+-transporting ATPase subunit b